MKIAVGTDDLKKIRKGHFGDSQYFLVFDVKEGHVVDKTLIENPHSGSHGDEDEAHHHGKAASIWSVLSGVHVFIGRSMGRHSVEKLIQKGVTPLLTQIEDVEEAVGAYLAHKMEKFYSFDLKEKKFKPAVS